jgi:prolyl-tRNA synthetase
VVIVPIYREGEEDVVEYSKRILGVLRESGVRAHLDLDTEHSPGWKYYYWELKGVPTRIEVGRRELASRTVTIVRRDTLERLTVPFERIVEALKETWIRIDESLKARALDYLAKLTVIPHVKPRSEKGLIIAPWLESNYGRSLLGEIVESPLQLPPLSEFESHCDKKPDRYALLGVTY